jgi:two-component system cell cycle sensor histidine kinase/response regulator CckA
VTPYPRPPPTYAQRKASVLEIFNKFSATPLLTPLGYQVVVCADGQEALDLFRKNPGCIDLLVMDVLMPSLSGPEAYLEMCALRPDIKVIFTTGYTSKAK